MQRIKIDQDIRPMSEFRTGIASFLKQVHDTKRPLKTDLLDSMAPFYSLLYIISSFVGISLTALFITVAANRFIRKR